MHAERKGKININKWVSLIVTNHFESYELDNSRYIELVNYFTN